MARRSIARSLTLGLIAVGVVGLAILLGAIVLDYHITFGGLADPRAFRRAWHEVSAHVLLPALVIALPMAFVAWRIVRHAMLPIENAALAVAGTQAAAPGVRIDTSDFPREIVPLAEGVNGLLGRMEGLAESNAAFAADVAHELRTPLTLLGLELEQIVHPQANRMKDQVRDMQKLVNQLLLIAQIDSADTRFADDQPVDLATIGMNVVAQMAPAALASGRMLAFEDLGSRPIAGESQSLAAALRNLVDNALRVTPPGGVVTVSAGPGAVLGVADGGPGLSAEELSRLSDRHARADNASQDGAGLGLAIVKKILSVHRGQLLSDPAVRRLSMEFPDLEK